MPKQRRWRKGIGPSAQCVAVRSCWPWIIEPNWAVVTSSRKIPHGRSPQVVGPPAQPWNFTFAATAPATQPTQCHGLAPWNFTFAAKVAASVTDHRASRWHRTENPRIQSRCGRTDAANALRFPAVDHPRSTLARSRPQPPKNILFSCRAASSIVEFP